MDFWFNVDHSVLNFLDSKKLSNRREVKKKNDFNKKKQREE